MTNLLEAISNIIENPNTILIQKGQSRTRANSVGEALETYIKDAFANSLAIEDENQKLNKYNNVFSWLGNQNNPPDIMIKGGDAIEVKKTQSEKSDIALNSSYPKADISSISNMITSDCRACENWVKKDLIYCVGHTDDTSIKSLWMVYGSIYAAKHETYELIKSKIASGVNEIPNVEFAQTNELGRVNRVDPLGITNLRVRGMWAIKNPRKVFDYLHKNNSNSKFELVVIIPKVKYESFPENSKSRILNMRNKGLVISNVKVKDPNNPSNLIDSLLMLYNNKKG